MHLPIKRYATLGGAFALCLFIVVTSTTIKTLRVLQKRSF